jgi:hypothetical protein
MSALRSTTARAATTILAAAGLALAGAGTATAAPQAHTASSIAARTISCGSLSGSGSYANPYVIGRVTGPTVVAGCAPLRSGAGYTVRYFSFQFAAPPSARSAVGTRYRPTAGRSGVHPRVASGPVTIKRSLGATYFEGHGYQGFGHTFSDVRGTGPWRLGAEKLSSPLGSLITASYDVVIVP